MAVITGRINRVVLTANSRIAGVEGTREPVVTCGVIGTEVAAFICLTDIDRACHAIITVVIFRNWETAGDIRATVHGAFDSIVAIGIDSDVFASEEHITGVNGAIFSVVACSSNRGIDASTVVITAVAGTRNAIVAVQVRFRIDTADILVAGVYCTGDPVVAF